jgi:uncharacterized repeat protein (TIGR01451 family)
MPSQSPQPSQLPQPSQSPHQPETRLLRARVLLLRLLALVACLPGLAVAAGTPAGTVISNTAVFDSEGGGEVRSNTYSLQVTSVCALALSPAAQTRTVQVGDSAVFAHTLTNDGNDVHRFVLSVSGGAKVSVDRNANNQVDADEAPISALSLDADQSAALLYSGTVSALGTSSLNGGGLAWTLDAECPDPADGTALATDTLVARASSLTLTKTLGGPAQVSAGDTVSYTLTLGNPNAVAVQGVTLGDVLPPQETLVNSEPPPTLTGLSSAAGQPLEWQIGTLEPGESRQFVVQVRTLATTPDDTLIVNVAVASSPDLPGTVQASAALRVFSSRLLLQKKVQETVADTGDTLHYTLTLSNPSGAALGGGVVRDVPGAGLGYLPGTARLDNQPLPDPAVLDAQHGGPALEFAVGALAAGQSRVLTYALQVSPSAGPLLENVASARAYGAAAAEVSAVVLSNVAQARTAHRAALFGGRADLAGRVYIDLSHVGHYVDGLDTPVPGARIVLAGGQEATSDAQGRYHFASLPPGHYALRLDPRSTPWAALPWPGDNGLNGSRAVELWGLAVVDFPLRRNTGGAR